jgi:hypothetical protein
VRNVHDASLARRSFQFYLPFEKFLQKGINVIEEDVFYNWMDMSSMTMSKVRKASQGIKEVHPLML